MKLEKEVKADIKNTLKDLNAWHYMPVPNGYGMKGVPDHIACVPMKITQSMVGTEIGVFVGVEAKRLGKASNPHQTLQLDKIREAKGLAFVVNGTKDEDGNFKMFKRLLNSLFGKEER